MAGRPNVVLICIDDHQMQAVQYMPWLSAQDAAGETIRFPYSTLTCPICASSRVTLHTGKRSRRTGTADNLTPTTEDHAGLDPAKLIGPVMQAAGYSNAMVGKYISPGYPWENGDTYTPPGWDEFHSTRGINYEKTRFMSSGVIEAEEDVHKTDGEWARVHELVDVLPEPFYMHFEASTPHHMAGTPGHGNLPPVRYQGVPVDVAPLTSKPSFNEADISDKPAWLRADHPDPQDAAAAAALIETYSNVQRLMMAFDDGMETLFGILAARGVLDNTVVIFYGDNGAMYGEHRHDDVKGVPYWESIHCDMRMWWPGGLSGVSDALVTNADLAPTITDLAGTKMPDLPDGQSMVPLMEGRVTADRFRSVVLIEEDSETKNNPGQPNPYYGAGNWSALVDQRWTYVEYEDDAGVFIEAELYDRVADPFEVDNLGRRPEYADQRVRFSRDMRRLRAVAD